MKGFKCLGRMVTLELCKQQQVVRKDIEPVDSGDGATQCFLRASTLPGVLQQKIEFSTDDGQRRPHIVRDIGYELLLVCLRLLQSDNCLL